MEASLLIRTESKIQIDHDKHLKHPDILTTQPNLGIATWMLSHQDWLSPIILTGCYWPTGPVPEDDVNTPTDHTSIP
jgi:hypothetical protein